MKNKNILFIYAHMDDETILSYGTIKKLSINNKVVIATLCGSSRNKNTNFERNISYQQNINTLKSEWIKFNDYQDLTLDKDIVNKCLNNCFQKYQPTIVFTHSQKDLHFEHRLVAEQVLLYCRNIPNSTVKSLYTTVSPTYNWTYGQYGNFQPNTFVDISEFVKEKQEALKLYNMELPKNQNDNRSIDSILTWNKMHGHTIGVKYCEPYEQILNII